jgi:peptidoglycan/LPS O-acetylase OafA/YrhL
MLHVPVATIVLTLGAHLLFPGEETGKLVMLPAAIIALVLASAASYRIFETPARQALNEAFDRYLALRTAIPAVVSRKDSR